MRLSRLPLFPYNALTEEWCSSGLIHFWVSHAGKRVTGDYSKLRDDLEFRKEVAARVCLAFKILSKENRNWAEWTEN